MNSTGVDEKSLGLRLQEARKNAGLTQQELCERAELAYSTLAKIERGAIKSPSIFTIQNIAGVLGISLDKLIGNTPSLPGSSKKVSKSGVKFVYFDVNGCLVEFFHQAFDSIARVSGVASDTIETTFWHYNDAVCRGEMSVAEFNSVLGKQFSVPEFDWQSYYIDSINPIPQMHELLIWAEKHYHVGLLSNIMPGFINVMQSSGLLPRLNYSAIIDSSEVKAIKPEAKIYDIAQSKAGVEPQEILFVDDSRTNLMAAEKMGWRVLWFDDFRPEESSKRVREALEFAPTSG